MQCAPTPNPHFSESVPPTVGTSTLATLQTTNTLPRAPWPAHGASDESRGYSPTISSRTEQSDGIVQPQLQSGAGQAASVRLQCQCFPDIANIYSRLEQLLCDCRSYDDLLSIHAKTIEECDLKIQCSSCHVNAPLFLLIAGILDTLLISLNGLWHQGDKTLGDGKLYQIGDYKILETTEKNRVLQAVLLVRAEKIEKTLGCVLEVVVAQQWRAHVQVVRSTLDLFKKFRESI